MFDSDTEAELHEAERLAGRVARLHDGEIEEAARDAVAALRRLRWLVGQAGVREMQVA